MKDRCCNRNDDDSCENGRNGKKCNIDSDEADKHCTLDGEAEHVARLGEDSGIARDRGKDARTADTFDRQQL